NGDGDIVLFAKAKAHQQVRNGLPRPVGADQVDRLQLLQVERLVVIPRGEIRFCTIREVTDVVQGDAVTIERRRGQDSHVSLPIARVRGGDRTPPQHQGTPYEPEAQECPAALR